MMATSVTLRDWTVKYGFPLPVPVMCRVFVLRGELFIWHRWPLLSCHRYAVTPRVSRIFKTSSSNRTVLKNIGHCGSGSNVILTGTGASDVFLSMPCPSDRAVPLKLLTGETGFPGEALLNRASCSCSDICSLRSRIQDRGTIGAVPHHQ